MFEVIFSKMSSKYMSMEKVWIQQFFPLKHLGRVQILPLLKLYVCYNRCTVDAAKKRSGAGLYSSGVAPRILRLFRWCMFMTLINT